MHDIDTLVGTVLSLMNEDFLGFLPLPLANAVRISAGMCFAFSLIAGRLKPLLAKPISSTAPLWKQRLFRGLWRVVSLIDIVALNTTTIRDKDILRRLLAERGQEAAPVKAIGRVPSELT